MSFFSNPLFNRLVLPVSFFSSLAGGAFLLRESVGGKKCPSKDDMNDKVVVITGASSGIGEKTAEEIAKKGASVILGCRHMEKCEKVAINMRQVAGHLRVVCRFLNLANLDSITKFASNLHDELDHIDVLINNAGVMKPRPPKTTPETDDGFERQFGVNHLGHFLLTNLVMDLLTNEDNPGRIINVASESSKYGEIDLDDIDKSSIEGDERLSQLYYQSKLANVCFTDSLDRLSVSKYEGKFTANSLNPGVVNTAISRYSNVPFYSPVPLIKPIKMYFMKTPLQGAQTSVYLAADKQLANVSGKYFDDCELKMKTCEICDSELADQLWIKSEEWTNLKERLESIRKNKILSKATES